MSSNLAVFAATTAVISGLGIASSCLFYLSTKREINNKIAFFENAVPLAVAGPLTGSALVATKMSAEYAWNCLSSAAMGEGVCGPYGSLATLGIGTFLTFVAANVVTASARYLAASAQHAILGSHG